MSDKVGVEGEESKIALPYPLPSGPSGIQWSPSRPATLEEIERAVERLEPHDGRPAPTVEQLAPLVDDALTLFDSIATDPAEAVARRVYMLFRDTASVGQRLAAIDEAWSRAFLEDRWPFSLFLAATLEREPALIAASAARYAAFAMMFGTIGWEEIGRLLTCAEFESEKCRAAVFLGLVSLGESELLNEVGDLRWELADDDVATICNITLVNPTIATVVFMLEWMEEAQRRNDQTRFAQLASAVERSGSASGAADPPSATTLDADDLRLKICYHPQRPITREQFNRQIQPRLDALAGRESGTQLIPSVQAAWGARQNEETA